MSTTKTKSRFENWAPKTTGGAPWTQGPWTTGPAPHGHCRVYAPTTAHAIARTYGPTLNQIGVCELTGTSNAANAALISHAPIMIDVMGRLQALTDLYRRDELVAAMNELEEIVNLSGEILDELIEKTGG